VVPVARRNLLDEKGRLAVSVAGVAIALVLVLIVLALYRGWSRTGSILAAMPGDIWVTQSGTVDPFHSVSILEDRETSGLASIDGVASVTPVLARRMTFTLSGSEPSVYLLALKPADVNALPETDRQKYLPPPGQVYIDELLSRKTGLHQGSRLTIGGREVHVGHVAPNQGEAFVQFVFVEYGDASAMFGVNGAVNFELLSLAPGASPASLIASINASGGRLEAFTKDQFAHSVRKEIDNSFLPIIAILTTIGFVVGAAVVGLTIYTATVERTKEFGLMKAVGASGGYLYRIVFSQSLILTLSGFVLGVVLARVIARLATQAVPEFTTEFRPSDVVAILLATLVMAVIASFIPVRRVLSVDPSSVFRA